MGFAVPSDVAVFLIGTFAAAFVTGLAGFAFGVVAAGLWLHALTPAQSAALVVAYALLVQGHAVWKLRGAINLRRLLPFVLGSAVGIPAGLAVLDWVPAARLRTALGVLLILFGAYNLLRPRLPDARRAGVAGSSRPTRRGSSWSASRPSSRARCSAGRSTGGSTRRRSAGSSSRWS